MENGLNDEERAQRWSDAIELDKATGITDDSCHGRCADLHDWMVWECRGLMDDEESHNVLDMVLNRLASDGLLVPPGEVDELRRQLERSQALSIERAKRLQTAREVERELIAKLAVRGEAIEHTRQD